jgi:hypothetical protein
LFVSELVFGGRGRGGLWEINIKPLFCKLKKRRKYFGDFLIPSQIPIQSNFKDPPYWRVFRRYSSSITILPSHDFKLLVLDITLISLIQGTLS